LRDLCLHAWLAFLAGILVVVGALLIYSASVGIAYYGIAIQIEAAIAVTLLVIAAISTWLFYAGVMAQYKMIKTGKEALIGSTGVTTTELKPKGEVRVLGEFWQARVQDGEIAAGASVEVVGMDGMFLLVKPAAEQKA
jgi:membrane-bound ClpP family serine protease